jgi:hypothetical protein
MFELHILEAVYVASMNVVLYLDQDWKMSLQDKMEGAERLPIS